MLTYNDLKKRYILPDEADRMMFDCGGAWWIYEKNEEVLQISKDGIKVIKFENLSKELKHNLEIEVIEENNDSTLTTSS